MISIKKTLIRERTNTIKEARKAEAEIAISQIEDIRA